MQPIDKNDGYCRRLAIRNLSELHCKKKKSLPCSFLSISGRVNPKSGPAHNACPYSISGARRLRSILGRVRDWGQPTTPSKALALTWYRAPTWYSSPAGPFAALDVPLLVTRQQGSHSPACRQLSRARNACAGGSREHGTKLNHGTK